MSERRTGRSKKTVDYSKFGADDSDFDDDFKDDCTPPPPKKTKVSNKENKKKDKLSSKPSENMRKERKSLEEKLYEKELKAALELSMTDSQGSQETPDKCSREPASSDVVVLDDPPSPIVPVIEESAQSRIAVDELKLGSPVQAEGPIEPIHLPKRPVEPEIEVLGSVVEEVPAKRKRKSGGKKNYVDDDSDDGGGSDFDVNGENFSEDDDDSDGDYDVENDSDFEGHGKKKKTPKAKKGGKSSVKTKATTAKKEPTKKNIKAKATSTPVPSRPVNVARKTPVITSPGNRVLSPGLTSRANISSKSPLGGVTIKSPCGGLRIGLSRNQRIKPLHANVKIQH